MKRLDFNKSPVLNFGENIEPKQPQREKSFEFLSVNSEAISCGDFSAAVLGTGELMGTDIFKSTGKDDIFPKELPFKKIKQLHNWD